MRLTCFLLLLLTAVDSFLLRCSHGSGISTPSKIALSLSTPNDDTSSPTRREFLSSSAAGIIAGSGCLRPSSAFAEENLVDFEDPLWKFSIKVPSGWDQSVQSLPDRRKMRGNRLRSQQFIHLRSHRQRSFRNRRLLVLWMSLAKC